MYNIPGPRLDDLRAGLGGTTACRFVIYHCMLFVMLVVLLFVYVRCLLGVT